MSEDKRRRHDSANQQASAGPLPVEDLSGLRALGRLSLMASLPDRSLAYLAYAPMLSARWIASHSGIQFATGTTTTEQTALMLATNKEAWHAWFLRVRGEV